MNIVREIAEVRAAVAQARAEGRRIGFVPTMGFLHDGHLSLIDLARERGATFIAVSIFVNPLQFGPAEDFERYPRDEDRDRRLLEERGVDLLFIPSVDAMYPAGAVTRVIVGGVADSLEGERRPGHFDGVATVVTKLFNIVQPDIAAFGQKDAQQCAVIRRIVRDLDMPVEIVVGETRREADGLAMSSRNAYLSKEQRGIAPALREALLEARAALETGEADPAAIERRMLAKLAGQPQIDVDYVRLVDPATFEAPSDLDRDLLAVGAIRLGSTRLIDNLPLPRAAAPKRLSPAGAGTERTRS
ncbi:MAG TPA: pantoate--beta-alanine ligase [Thermoanaerobaculia bacterium]|nr:pantoate--beta-alanine ligase [Thermoanaerobaculia bacterium]